MREESNEGESGRFVLLPSKVTMPSPPSNVLARPLVSERLSHALACPLTTVVTSAGFGKTTSVVSWATTLDNVPVAWYRIDAEDAALERYCLYLAAALRVADKRICLALDEARMAGGFQDVRPVLDDLILQIAEYGRDFVCVLEDFHEVRSSEDICESMRYLVKHLPTNAHFVVTSRQPLHLPTAKMKVAGQLVEVTEAHLRFSLEETCALFAELGIRLAKDEAEAIQETTQGWVTGGKLVALLCGDGSKSQVREAVERAQGSINDYLFEEVFSVLEPERRRFLTSTSVVNSFCLPLAERITGLPRAEVVAQVDFLIENDLFIERFERKGGEDWYRYHRLLADLLHQRLSRQDPAEVQAMSRAARDWLEENGFYDDAVKTSAELKDYERVRQTLIDNWLALYMGDSHHVLTRWASYLPDGELMKSPLLCAVLSMPYALRGDFQKAEACLKNAIGHLHADEDFLFAMCLVQKAYLASFRDDRKDMRAYAEKALQYLPEKELYLRGMMLQVKAASFSDEPLKAKASFERAVETQCEYGNSNLSCSAYCNLALICANLGYLQEASYYAGLAFDLYPEHERRFKPMLTYAYLTTMACAYERGDCKQALEVHDTVSAMSAEGAVPCYAAQAMALKAKALWRLGTGDAEQTFFRALSLNEAGALLAYPPLAFAQAYCTAFRTKALERCAQMPAQAQTALFDAMAAYFLDPSQYEAVCAYVDAIDEGERSARVHGLVVAAAFSEKAARYARADAYLEEAARLAREHGLGEALAENALYLRPAFLRLAPKLADAGLADYLGGLLQADAGVSDASRLTEREVDVMRCIASGATAAETAERLFVSRDTVKKHLANVYAKLGVHSKMQAVALLRDEGVI